MKKLNRPFTAREAEELGVSRQALSSLVKSGKVNRIACGIYIPHDYTPTRYFSLQIAALKSPSSVVCLLSALCFHEFTTQNPPDLYLSLEAHKWIPSSLPFGVRVFSMKKDVLSFGVEEHILEGIVVHVTSPAKTVADLFKFRSKIGLDVALEALREGFQKRLFTISELMAAAAVCRVKNIITPYAESLFT